MIRSERERLQHLLPPPSKLRRRATLAPWVVATCMEDAVILFAGNAGLQCGPAIESRKGGDMSEGAVRRVGIIGLGKMGQPMARHLRKAGFDVTASDIDERARSAAQSAGVAVVATPRAVAQASDFVIVVVGFDKEAEVVILGPDGIAAAARPGLIVGVASTVAPRTMARLAAGLAGTGIVLLDMPITRGEPAAEAGQLLVMVGGDAGAFEACKGALRSFASSIFHLGDLGAGQVGKMVNNMILWSCISANFEGFKLAQALGVDLDRLRAALVESSASNWALQTQIDRFPMPWAEKDMRIVLTEADDLRLSLPLCGVVTEVVKALKIERGWPTPKLRDA
jgi:3-hydroxyisobutyrate dehydrogenase-like beta-hydroxyacid dehydrogenase